MIPAAFDYVRAGSRGRGDQPHRPARRRRQVPRRWPQPAAADEAAPGPAERVGRHRADQRAVVHPRRRRPHRHRGADAPPWTSRRPSCSQQHVPLLKHAASHVGDPQVRHRGTIGGSIAHADPASDLPATTLALGATYVATGPNGTREIAAADFYESFLDVDAGARRAADRDPRAEDERGRLELPEVQPPGPGLGDRRGGGVAAQR